MEPTRSGKKKKSPKSRHKRGNTLHHSSGSTNSSHHTTSQTAPSQTSVSATGDYSSQPKDELTSTTEQTGPEVLPTPPPSEVTSPTDDQEDVIGTTPVAHGVTVIDIRKQFQVRPISFLGII